MTNLLRVKSLLFFLLFFVTGCSYDNDPLVKKYRIYQIYRDEIVKDFNNEASTMFDIAPYVNFGGLMSHVVEINVSFYVYRPITEEEGRELVVQLHEMLLEKANGKKEIRPYLEEYPFKPRNITIFLFVAQKNNLEPYSPPFLSGIAAYDGKIRYKKDLKGDNLGQEYLRETYEEAKSKVIAKK